MEATMERCPSDFDAPAADKMDQEELQPFESVTLPPIKIEQEEEENAEKEPEEEEDFELSNYVSTSVSPVKNESEASDESEDEEEIEPSSFLSVSMTTVKDEPEEQQQEEEDDDDEELEPLASVIVPSPMDDVPPKSVQHPRGEWTVHMEGQQQPQVPGGRRVVSSGVWVPSVEGPSPSSAASPTPPQPQPPSEEKRPSNTPKPFSCEVCAKSFTQKYTLKMHRRVHSEKMPYRCRACPASFESPSALSLHVAAHKAQRRYPCDVCGASFIQRGELNIHLRSHSEARPHGCMLCDKAYKQKSKNELDKKVDLPVVTQKTPSVVDTVESSGAKGTFQDEDRCHNSAPGITAVGRGGPPTGLKRKAEKVAHVEKSVDEISPILKHTAVEPTVAKDESYLFCELLNLKLRALDDVSCEIAMHEINNLMFHFKNSRILQPKMLPFPQYFQQPGYIQSDVQHFPGMSHHQSSVCKSSEGSAPSSLLRGLLQINKKMK